MTMANEQEKVETEAKRATFTFRYVLTVAASAVAELGMYRNDMYFAEIDV